MYSNFVKTQNFYKENEKIMPPKKGKKAKIDEEERLEQFGIYEEEDEDEEEKESWRDVG